MNKYRNLQRNREGGYLGKSFDGDKQGGARHEGEVSEGGGRHKLETGVVGHLPSGHRQRRRFYTINIFCIRVTC